MTVWPAKPPRPPPGPKRPRRTSLAVAAAAVPPRQLLKSPRRKSPKRRLSRQKTCRRHRRLLRRHHPTPTQTVPIRPSTYPSLLKNSLNTTRYLVMHHFFLVALLRASWSARGSGTLRGLGLGELFQSSPYLSQNAVNFRFFEATQWLMLIIMARKRIKHFQTFP